MKLVIGIVGLLVLLCPILVPFTYYHGFLDLLKVLGVTFGVMVCALVGAALIVYSDNGDLM